MSYFNMKTRNTYNDKEWQEIAAYLSGESEKRSDLVENFLDDRGQQIETYWIKMDKNRGEERVNVDQAWDKLFSKLSDDKLVDNKSNSRSIWSPLLRIAAVLVILIATTFTVKFILNDSTTNEMLSVNTTISEKNRIVLLADGSRVTLNRDSRLTYPEGFSDNNRRVELSGEAFFEIKHDPDRPFIVEAGKGEVKVLGTSFNVISNNSDSELEVFVKSGKVLLYGTNGEGEVTLDPGFIGKMDEDAPSRELNSNPNYMSWNTEILTYDGTSLKQVFSDLKRVHDISVEVDDNSILDRKITTKFNNNSPDTIIEAICTSYDLTFEKEGEIYYLSR